MEELDQKIDLIIVIKVKDDNIVERMGGRRVHPSSGRIYHIKYNPPKNEGKDDQTGEELIIRDDDQENTVRKRLEIYHKETSPLIEYYKSRSRVCHIDGEQSIDQVSQSIDRILS